MKSSPMHERQPTFARAAGPILEEMAEIIGTAQSALLGGKLAQLEITFSRQRVLCHELQACLKQTSSMDKPSISTAQDVVRQNRVFAAVLRRMKTNLERLLKAGRAPSPVYEARRETKH